MRFINQNVFDYLKHSDSKKNYLWDKSTSKMFWKNHKMKVAKNNNIKKMRKMFSSRGNQMTTGGFDIKHRGMMRQVESQLPH